MPTHVLVLRLASITDADAIVAFDHVAASEPARVQFIHDQIQSSACYVAVIKANVVAYAVLNYNFYDNGWIEMLYVHPRFRRQGIGAALIRHLIIVHIDESIQCSDAAAAGNAGIRAKWPYRKP